jgi:hypothetical protein
MIHQVLDVSDTLERNPFINQTKGINKGDFKKNKIDKGKKHPQQAPGSGLHLRPGLSSRRPAAGSNSKGMRTA